MKKEVQATGRTSVNAACIPPNYSRLIARVLGLQARELPTLLMQTGLSVNQLMQDDSLLTSSQQMQILQNALRMTDDELFGLRIGQCLTPTTHGAMGFLASSSPNLLIALKAFETYLPTRADFSHLELKRSEYYWECYCYFDMALDADVHRVISEAYASILFQCAEFIIGQPVEGARTCFSFAEPDYSQCYAEFLPGGVEFSSPELVLKIPAHLCDIPNAAANNENYSLALRQCQSMLQKLPLKTNNWTHRLQKLMLSQPPGVLSEEEAAAMMFISKRTLARRLELEGRSFRSIRDEILSQQASSYLRSSTMSVDAIAAVLSYHDSSNFRRAFKRWFQLTPDQYRKQARSQPHD
ncbi:AraC family transcriptional regulator [Marinobacter sediminicola]|uniref:AraC family transcriptional regulator n=1 Tax=Marinobacter sediminicola TaxID=3072994 RepID=UPI002811A474|nr:AraC family transcriptional regulator ligand-binding domain-containing protein [Marinobacter sp. F26243]